MPMIEIERKTLFEEKPSQGGRKQVRNNPMMVRFPNLINRGIFRLKGYADDTTTNNGKGDALCRDTHRGQQQRKTDIISTAKIETLTKQKESVKNVKKSDDKKNNSEVVDDFLESKTAPELRDEIRNMKRAFLYQENNLIEKWEQEKIELREQYEEEKKRLKKAFENDKVELLKEIERKDKMLEKLAEVLKEQHQKNMKDYQTNMEEKWSNCFRIHTELKSFVDKAVENTQQIINNNQNTFGNLDEFKCLQEHQEQICTLLKKVEKSPLSLASDLSFDENRPTPELSLARSISEPTGKSTEMDSSRKTFRDSNKKARSFEEQDVHTDDIQHEMAEVYRQQKTLLVNLFNAEKEEERKRLCAEKKTFERDVRTEYDSRMCVERKAWQETIEDLEREINILRYEREQLDRNYCLGMDEMKTGFEVEKQQMYRRFSETQHLYEKKIKEFLSNTKNDAIEKKVSLSE